MLFAVTVSARKKISASVSHNYIETFMTEASSELEAKGLGLEAVQFFYPASEGHEDYTVGVFDASKRIEPRSEWKRCPQPSN